MNKLIKLGYDDISIVPETISKIRHRKECFCYDENLSRQSIFRECSEDELTLLFSALIENNALDWGIALEIAKILPEKGHLIEDKFSIDEKLISLLYVYMLKKQFYFA